MPLYEYQCQQCGKRSETLQNMGAAPLTTCEVCGGPLKRLVSSPAVQFKGSGFYATDYARKGGGAGKEGGKEGGGKEGGDKPAGDAAKSESKAGGGDAKPAASSSGGSGSSGSSSSSASSGSSSGSSSGGGGE